MKRNRKVPLRFCDEKEDNKIILKKQPKNNINTTQIFLSYKDELQMKRNLENGIGLLLKLRL